MGRANKKYSTDRKQGDDGSQHEQANRVSHVLSIAKDAKLQVGARKREYTSFEQTVVLETPPNAILSAFPP